MAAATRACFRVHGQDETFGSLLAAGTVVTGKVLDG
jgi:hypothetical protein